MIPHPELTQWEWLALYDMTNRIRRRSSVLRRDEHLVGIIQGFAAGRNFEGYFLVDTRKDAKTKVRQGLRSTALARALKTTGWLERAEALVARDKPKPIEVDFPCPPLKR